MLMFLVEFIVSIFKTCDEYVVGTLSLDLSIFGTYCYREHSKLWHFLVTFSHLIHDFTWYHHFLFFLHNYSVLVCDMCLCSICWQLLSWSLPDNCRIPDETTGQLNIKCDAKFYVQVSACARDQSCIATSGVYPLVTQCFDAVGWAAGRASGL